LQFNQPQNGTGKFVLFVLDWNKQVILPLDKRKLQVMIINDISARADHGAQYIQDKSPSCLRLARASPSVD